MHGMQSRPRLPRFRGCSSLLRRIEAIWRRVERPSETDRWELPLFEVGQRDHPGMEVGHGLVRGSADRPVRAAQRSASAFTASGGAAFKPASGGKAADASPLTTGSPARETGGDGGAVSWRSEASCRASALAAPVLAGPGPGTTPDEWADTLRAVCAGIRATVRGAHRSGAAASTVGLAADTAAEVDGVADLSPDAVVDGVSSGLSRAAVGERVFVSGCEVPVVLARIPTAGELARIRRRFKSSRAADLTRHSAAAAAVAFVGFLNEELTG